MLATKELSLVEALEQVGWISQTPVTGLGPSGDQDGTRTFMVPLGEVWCTLQSQILDGTFGRDLWARTSEVTKHEKVDAASVVYLSVESTDDGGVLSGRSGLKLYQPVFRPSRTEDVVLDQPSSTQPDLDVGGRPPVYHWGLAMDRLVLRIGQKGLPESKKQLARWLADEVDGLQGISPTDGAADNYLIKNFPMLRAACRKQ